MRKIYTDGSCLELNYGGWSFIEVQNNTSKLSKSGGVLNTTNNRMELTAVLECLKYYDGGYIKIYSDSNYVVKGVNEWLRGWRRKNFKKVKNIDLWKKYIKLSKKFDKIELVWVKAHNGNKFNEEADKLALMASRERELQSKNVLDC